MPTTKEESKPQYLSLQEMAKQLKVSERTIIRWVRSGELRAFRLGHVTRVTKEDFDKFLKKYTLDR
ncbi:MAG: helix-turn-helix domain-containing protein [Anaerolineales bacterium]|nr:helix-turn-helix domain-containing protein [Anaerolineales bacterium]